MCRRWLLVGVWGMVFWYGSCSRTRMGGRHGCECAGGVVNEVGLLVMRDGINCYAISLSVYPANGHEFRNGCDQ